MDNFNRRTKYLNWDSVYGKVFKIISNFEREGVKPTVRGLLYILESMNVLKKTDYNNLSKHLVKWREQGDLSIDCVADKTRSIIDIHNYWYKGGRRILVDFDEELQTWDDLISPEEHIQSGIDYLNDAAVDLYNHIPRWLNQPNYVEIFVEKSGMGNSFKSILDNGDPESDYGTTPRHVIVNPNGGWSSYTFVMKNLDRMVHQQKMGKEVYVQYYGDSDPSGERMTAEDSKLVTKLNAHGINFERIAITEDTIQDFELEDIKNKELDTETLKKLESDPNYKWFIQRHHGQVWQIELDALLLNLPKFKQLVLSNVDKHFDTVVVKVYSAIGKDVYHQSASTTSSSMAVPETTSDYYDYERPAKEYSKTDFKWYTMLEAERQGVLEIRCKAGHCSKVFKSNSEMNKHFQHVHIGKR